MPATFCHIEIPCLDVPRSSEFFGKLFGWLTQPLHGDEYHLVKLPDGSIIGGLSKVPTMPDNSAFQNYVEVENVAKTLDLARSLGAKVHQERRELPASLGFVGIVVTADGYYLGIWSRN